jgi:GxxExxY protein
MLYPELSKKILDAVYAVHRELGPGLLEQCYHNALYYELQGNGLAVRYNEPFNVSYKGHPVGGLVASYACCSPMHRLCEK